MLRWKLVASWRQCSDFLWVACTQYPRSFAFAKIDLRLLLSYWWRSPFHVSKQFLIEKGETDVYTYGETPLRTLEAISARCGVSEGDTVYELGCGRARTCFWLAQRLGCRVVGIDFVPTFIERAQRLAERYELNQCRFYCADFIEFDDSDASYIYLYGSSLPDETIRRLAAKWSKHAEGLRIVTVSYALTGYDTSGAIQLIDAFPAAFTWGEATVYLHEVAGSQ